MLGPLPQEVWVCVGECLDADQEISALARTCRSLYRFLRPWLYRHNALHSDSSALLWAATHGNSTVAKHAIAGGADVNAYEDTGQSCLHIAATNGHEAIAALLIRCPDIELDAQNEDDETPLLCAASNGQGGIVKQLLSTGKVDPNIFCVNVDMGINHCSLLIAAAEGHRDVVEALLQCDKTDVRCEDDYGDTPLCVAAGRGHADIVDLILDSGRADVNHVNEMGQTALVAASTAGHVECVKSLLQDPLVDVEIEGDSGSTVFGEAARSGHIGVVRVLLESGKVSYDMLDEEGNSPLVLAARHGDVAFFKILLASGRYETNSRNSFDQTPLIAAAESGSLEIVKMLVATGEVDANYRAQAGETPFLMAVAKGHLHVVEYLLQNASADASIRDASGGTIIMSAAANGRLEVLEYLLTHNLADLAATDDDGDTVLSTTAAEGHLEILKLLLDTGNFDVEARNANGWTPLMWACYGGHLPVVEFLLDSRGSNYLARDVRGQTAMHCTCLHRHDSRSSTATDCIARVQVLKFLEKQGCSIFDVDEAGCTPLHMAAANGCVDMLTYLVYKKGALHAKDNNGRLPHFYAAMRGEGTESILSHHTKADNAADAFGNTPVFVAARNGHDRVLRSLLGSNPWLLLQKDTTDRTLFYWGARQRNEDVKTVLEDACNKDLRVREKVLEMGIDPESVLATEWPPEEKLMRLTDDCDWCRVCCRAVGVDSSLYRCKSCDGGSFVVCTECHGHGRRCRESCELHLETTST